MLSEHNYQMCVWKRCGMAELRQSDTFKLPFSSLYNWMHSCILSYIVLHVFKAQIWIWSNSANRKNSLHDKVMEINKFVNEPLLNIFCITRFINILIQNKTIVKKSLTVSYFTEREAEHWIVRFDRKIYWGIFSPWT